MPLPLSPPPPPSPSLLLSLLQCPLRPPPPLGLDGVSGPVSPARSDGSCFSNHLNTSFRSNGEEGHRDDEDAEAEGYALPHPDPCLLNRSEWTIYYNTSSVRKCPFRPMASF